MNGQQVELSRNPEFPFGELHGGTLIVCLSKTHRKNVAEAFRKVGRYVIPGAELHGDKFDTIIMFTPNVSVESATDMNLYKNWVDHMILTKLSPVGKAYYV